MTKPFEFVTAISETKKDLMRNGSARESDYVPFLVNRALSYHADAVLYANDMNCMPTMPKVMQHDYLMESLRPRRRFSKWYKPDSSLAEEVVSAEYGYSRARAREALAVLRDDQIKQLIEKHTRDK